MNSNSTKMHIDELCKGATRTVESAPAYQIVGSDGSGWYQQVGHDHDVKAQKADVAELRLQLRQKIASQLELHKDRPQAGLFRMLELAVVRSDSAVFRSAELVGFKPSNGLYYKIKEILVAEDGLDPKSELWTLLGIPKEVRNRDKDGDRMVNRVDAVTKHRLFASQISNRDEFRVCVEHGYFALSDIDVFTLFNVATGLDLTEEEMATLTTEFEARKGRPRPQGWSETSYLHHMGVR